MFIYPKVKCDSPFSHTACNYRDIPANRGNFGVKNFGVENFQSQQRLQKLSKKYSQRGISQLTAMA